MLNVDQSSNFRHGHNTVGLSKYDYDRNTLSPNIYQLGNILKFCNQNYYFA